MLKNTLFTILITCCICQFSTAQTVDEIKQVFPGYDIIYQNFEQKITLSLKDNLPAAERKSNIDMLMLTDKNINMLSRYKVYHSHFNELTQLDAYTLVPNGNKYKTVKSGEKKISNSTDRSIFYDDMKETAFDFNALKQNAIAHVDYTQINKDAHLLTGFYIPDHMPVLNAIFTVIVPNNISIRYLVKNDPSGLFQFSEEKKKKETVYKWTLKNMKPSDNYSNEPDFRYYQPHILIYIASFENENGSQPFLSTLDDLHKWNYSFLKDLNKTPDPALKKIVDSLTAGLINDHDKAKRIYKWVQQHIKYVAFENGVEGFRPRQASEVCAKRYGDCKDMSSIITQMLRMAGLKAYYTWIGTRDLPYNYTEIPSSIVNNHMISTVVIDGNWFFLDGTDPNAKFDMPPAFIQGKEALININENEFKVLTVPVALPEKNVLTDSTFLSLTDDGIKGCQNVRYNGYFGKDLYTSLLYKDERETKEFINNKLRKGSNKFILGKYYITRTAPDENIATITADFELPGYSKKIGKEYYINLNLVKIFENQVIDIEKRKIPMEFNYSFNIKQYHILDIPGDYTVTHLPKNFSFENHLVKIDLLYKVVNNRIIATQEVKNKKLMIYPSDFDEWNKPMKAIQPYYNESVVLEKK